ncbi:MAG: GAF domain-containing protein, partial [Candidatus Latescibacteria bacterium]|nr:GAF domain-containing protein [Candidatus Latescibacterota bacterium]
IIDDQDVVLHFDTKPLRLRIGEEGLVGWVAANKKALITNDVARDPRYLLVPGIEDSTRSEMIVPIIRDGELLGVLDMHEDKVNAFSDIDLQFAEVMASLVGIALQNIMLYDRSRIHVKRLSIIAELAADLTALQDVPDLLERTMKAIVDRLEYSYAGVALMEGNQLVVKAFFGVTDHPDTPSKMETGQNGIAGIVAVSGEGIIVEDAQNDPRYIGNRSINSAAVVPLRLGSRVLGVVNVESTRRHAFLDIDRQIIQTLADQVAVALENARLYQMLQETQSQLVESERLRAVGELAAGVAHNFNNILTSILGYTELLTMEPDLKPFLSHLEVITQAAQQGASIARQLQDFTRVQASASMHALNLNNAIEQAVRITRPRWAGMSDSASRQIDVVTELADIPPVNGNSPELVEVYTNLILNAVDAMPGGGALTITSEEREDDIVVTVRDTGSGMAPETRSRVFEPFFTTKGPTLGSGLGLSVAHGIIKRHGGAISVESTASEGTVFTTILPSRTEPPETVARLAEKQVRPQRVLVIDDEIEVRELMVRMLDEHNVDIASSGESGIQLFQQYRHDIVFTDIGMPGLSGWNVAHVVRQTDPSVAVVAITGWGKHFSSGQRQAGDVDVILPKPFTIKEVRDVLAKAVKMRADRQGSVSKSADS